MLQTADVIEYKKLFSVELSRPLLTVDLTQFEKQLTQAWNRYKSGMLVKFLHC